MLNKKLRGSSKKYFDSGDYIMERDRSVSKPTKNRPPQLVLKGSAIKVLTCLRQLITRSVFPPIIRFLLARV